MKVNWLGIISSIIILTLLITPFIHPSTSWWRLTAGNEEGYMIKVDVSPFQVDVIVWGSPLESPILTYITSCISLILIVTAITMMLGSIFINQTWSKYLFDFAYLKPAITFLFFVGLLLIISGVTSSIFKSEIPLMGDVNINFLYEDSHIMLETSIPMHTTFSWTFILALVTSILSIVAKIYQDKLCNVIKTLDLS